MNSEDQITITLIDNDLPEGWVSAKLPEIVEINMGQSPPGRSYNNRSDGLPFFQGKADFGNRYPTVRVWCSQPKKIAQPGDVLISVRAPVGPTNVADRVCAIGRGLAAITPLGKIPTEFILFRLRLLEPELALKGTGSTFTAISRKDLEEIDIDVPPMAEQKRIVAKVEELLTRVNATKERLAKVAMILKRFRQAVLAAACSGRLTTDWREQQTILESASALLARLQQQHLRMDNSGFLENDLPEIPGNWIWAKVGQLGDVTTGSTPPKKEASYFGGLIPFFKPTDLDAGYNVEKSIDSLTEEGAEIARILPPLAVMVTCIGATIGKTGLGRVVGATNQQINSVVTNHEFVSPYWLFWTFTSPWVQEQIKLHASETTLPILNKGRFEKLSLPLPPLTEQQEIVHRVESMFKLADAVKKRVAAAKVRSDKLTQAILAKAFRGELVPTEAEIARRERRSYETASELLSRINSERDAKQTSQKARRNRN